MKKNKILLRFDDICSTMNWKQWNKAKATMDEVGITALLGVIPDNQDPDLMIDEPKIDFWDYIKQLQKQGYTIAMHGYQHLFDINAKGLITFKKHSEFAGHSFDEQFRRIKEGKKILEGHGIKTDIFFAPAHSYDDNTLKALAANGFKYISDGMSCKAYKRHGIICLPARSGGVPRIRETGNFTVILHAHEWEYKGKQKSWDSFERICKLYVTNIVSFDEYRKQKKGNIYVQRMYELLYMFFAKVILPILGKLMRLFK